ncbi:hypothetical protein [Actinoplanes sp. DH11]|uniref:hypothetical protein n=1 Tax=Actinoplanes sp. DH11 TaxID=2857011 RepID=UPI001E34A487|nr:hypothetical protein [Actinoplanes sp. DH11]
MTGPWGYRVLLLAYPAGDRRDELLDTVTATGRTVPSWREVPNLLRHGLRARLGRPGGTAVVVAALLVALTSGYFAAAGADRLAWEAVPELPTGAELDEITGTVFPGLPVAGERYGDGLFHDVMDRGGLGGHDEDFEFAGYGFSPDGGFVKGDYREWTSAAAGRLSAAGWQVREIVPIGATDIATGALEESGRSLWASREGLTLELETETTVVGTPPGSFDVIAEVKRLPPWFVTTAGLAGWFAGALLGWLVFGWACRRTEAAGSTVRVLASGAVTVALAMLLPLSLYGVFAFTYLSAVEQTPFQPFWGFSATYGYGCTGAGLFLWLAALLLAAFAGRSPAPGPAVDRS